MSLKRREFLAAGIGLGLALPNRALAQAQKDVATRSAKTTRLFKSPGHYAGRFCLLGWHQIDPASGSVSFPTPHTALSGFGNLIWQNSSRPSAAPS